MKKTILRMILIGAIGLVAGWYLVTMVMSQSDEDTIIIDVEKEEEEFFLENEDARFAYGKVLWDAYQQGVLPDGGGLDYVCMEAAEENYFSIMDIDGDGKEELLLFWVNASMAGNVGYVFGYDGGTVHLELTEFPIMTFYDNGAVKADWSHNQGLAGDFWPYNVYLYDAEKDVYQFVGAVDAWDKSLREDNEQGVMFPEDIDADGDGILYYLLPTDWDWSDRQNFLADGSEYEKWRDNYFGDAKEIPIQTKELTEENIAALGCPKPEIEITEPAG